MADTENKPMSDADITPPPATTDFQPEAPLKDTGVAFEPAGDEKGQQNDGAEATTAKQAIVDGAGKIGAQATDKVRGFVQDGQARAGSALDQVVQMLTDAAEQVDGKLGSQYGDYARSAASTVSGFSDTVKNKDADELFEDVRTLVRKSPGVAVGVAAALGFVVARLVQSGIEAERGRSNDAA